MLLRDELFKLYNPLRHNANHFIRHRRHPVQLRIVGKMHSLARTSGRTLDQDDQDRLDNLVYKYYID